MTIALKVSNLSKKFIDFVAVDNVCFEIPYGQITALLGANGAGKSTTLNMIAGIMVRTNGTIEYGGLNFIDHYKEIKRKVGYLTSDMSLYNSLTLEENLKMFGKFKGMDNNLINDRVEELSSIFDLNGFQDKHFSELSSGQKQRSLIASSILHDPEILIFDEVTASLDVVSAKKIMDFLKTQSSKGKAVIFATHILSEVEYVSDRILLVKKGVLVKDTTFPKLINETMATNLTEAFFKVLKDEEKEVA